MKTTNEGLTIPQGFANMLATLKEFLHTDAEASQMWDLITALRGPDTPSERPNMTHEESAKAYRGRRARKALTVEVIRGKAFGGVCLGARTRTDRDYVTLPPKEEWEHFDKHVYAAAQVLGLKVRIGEKGRWGTQMPKGTVEVKLTKAEEKPKEKPSKKPPKPTPYYSPDAKLASGIVAAGAEQYQKWYDILSNGDTSSNAAVQDGSGGIIISNTAGSNVLSIVNSKGEPVAPTK